MGVENLVGEVIASAAKHVNKQQRGYVEIEDLIQEGWVWALENKQRIADWAGEDDTRRLSVTRKMLWTAVTYRLHRYCMEQRYQKDGTKPGDYYFYTKQVVEDLLPEVLDGTPGSRSTSDLNTLVTRTRQPSEGFEREATVADIKAGLARLTDEDKQLLADRYADGGLSTQVMAAQRGVPLRTIQFRLNRALRTIIKELGGEPPRRQMRKRMSNAQAIYETAVQESP